MLFQTLERSATALRQLDLSWNRIGVGGAEVIGAALADNSTLRQLDISHCCIPPEGSVFLAAGLAQNTSLATLKIDSNPLGAKRKAFGTLFAGVSAPLGLQVVAFVLPETIGASILIMWVKRTATPRMRTEFNRSLRKACVSLLLSLSHRLVLIVAERMRDGAGEKGREELVRSLQDRQIRLSMKTGSSKPEPDLLFASNQPLHDLKANASGRYKLDLAVPPHRAIAAFLVAQGTKKGADSWRNEMLDALPIEFDPSFQLPDQGVRSLPAARYAQALIDSMMIWLTIA